MSAGARRDSQLNLYGTSVRGREDRPPSFKVANNNILGRYSVSYVKFIAYSQIPIQVREQSCQALSPYWAA
jgi:hypothetical protein